MFTDLALIDWIALAFSAVLLAAATAAATIAYATSSHRSKRRSSSGMPLPIIRSTLKRSTPRHAADSRHAVDSRNVVEQDPSPSSSTVRADKVIHAPVLDADAQLAARAAKLRRRPVPEHNGYEHKKRVVSVAPTSTPAHAKAAPPLFERASGGVATVHFDRTEGFKARTPGFFEDPMGRHELRYWDGRSWTEYVKEHGERFTDPL